MQHEYKGIGSITQLEDILQQESTKSIFLVCGGTSFEQSGARELVEPALQKYTINTFSYFSANPKFEDVVKGIELFHQTQPDIILAIGGGSSIDVAKSINILSQMQNPENYITQKEGTVEKLTPVIAVPTTCGSGSEATHFSVLYYQGKKYSLAHEELLPTHVILDPQLIETLPKHILATSGMDAFCQAVESFWSVNSTQESKEYSREALGLLKKHLVQAYTTGKSKEKEPILYAANLAGKAINITKTTASHALSYSLTTQYGIPHGQAVAMTIGEVLEYNSLIDPNHLNDSRGVAYVQDTIKELLSLLDVNNPSQAQEKIHHLMSALDLATTIPELTNENELAEQINLERLKNNPYRFSKDQIVDIYASLR